MIELQRRLEEVAVSKGMNRPAIAQAAQRVASRAWHADPPVITEEGVRDVQERLTKPPRDGRALRAIVAVHGISMIEALTLMDYWPDLLLGSAGPVSMEQLIVEACRLLGVEVSVVDRSGRKILLEIR